MHKVKLNHAFQSASLEVLVCLKQLFLENEELKSQIKSRTKCEHDAHSYSTQRVNQDQMYCCEIDASQMDLADLLNLCSSQAAEIFRLKSEMQALQTSKSALERELHVRDLELHRANEVIFRSNESNQVSKMENTRPHDDASTQTVPEMADSPRYLRVQGQDQSFQGEEILPQNHGRMIFDHMFTPRSRNMSNQGGNLDSIERIIHGMKVPDNSIRQHIPHQDTHNMLLLLSVKTEWKSFQSPCCLEKQRS
jgi:hypothetical protein